MNKVTAQELKTGGLTAVKKLLLQTRELFVQERGKESCVIIDLEYFNELKMCELEVAYLKAQADIKNDNFEVIDDAQKHVNQLLKEIDNKNAKVN